MWSQGILPIDSIQLLSKNRPNLVKQDTSSSLDWDSLRERVKSVGMRNSNTMAIAPTATIANITGVTPSIEPLFSNLFAKANLSGNFAFINTHLVNKLKSLNLWDESMITDLKYCNGVIDKIERIPQQVKELFSTAYEIEPRWLIECASRRQKWIDQAQSLNLYIAVPDGKMISDMYKLAWLRGLKTTYYLRSQAASQAEKSTMQESSMRGVELENQQPSPISSTSTDTSLCLLDDPDCESCQ